MSVWAGEALDSKVINIIDWGFWPILVAAFCGGITATFIKTEVDNQLTHDSFAKLIIGIGLGLFTCMSWKAYSPDVEIMKLTLPAFVLGSLGAPIMVFLLTWASDPKTRKKAEQKLNNRLGLPEDIE